MSDQQVFTGILKKASLHKGSKSEHQGMVLVSEGIVYKIVRIGQNPFQDDELEKLSGQKVEVKGELIDRLIRASEITIC